MTTNIYGFAKKIVRFYIVGGIAVLGNAGIMYIFSDVLMMPFVFSIGLIFLFNITLIFYLQKIFTFKDKSSEYLLKKFFIFLIWTGILMIILYIFLPKLQFLLGNYFVGSLVLSGVVTIINFLVQNFFIFYRK